jgi:hypothetical protein
MRDEKRRERRMEKGRRREEGEMTRKRKANKRRKGGVFRPLPRAEGTT